MAVTSARVPTALFGRLAEQLTHEQMVELTAAIAPENFSARFNRAFGIEPEDYYGRTAGRGCLRIHDLQKKNGPTPWQRVGPSRICVPE